MPPETPKPPKETGLIIPPGSGLALLPNEDPPVLSEIINRSLAHIQTRKSLSVTERRAREEWEFEIAPGVKMVMCWIPPGEFLMGSPEDEEERDYDETQHRVKITQGFWLAKTPTTQAQWQAVMGNNPSRFQGEDLPVESVSWDDICGNESGTGGFLGALNELIPMGGRFHLPTEAQWEYACRAGTTEPYYGDLDEIAWYDDNSDDKTHAVGQKKPNEWGLHDMLGNVWEWCSDWFGDYDMLAVTDPAGPASGSHRVYRGGFWRSYAGNCRVAARYYRDPGLSAYDVGFRPARSSVP
jgi:formylglycine-generating enzyme required for sulfatase activity